VRRPHRPRRRHVFRGPDPDQRRDAIGFLVLMLVLGIDDALLWAVAAFFSASCRIWVSSSR
jgi:hypothetical protein